MKKVKIGWVLCLLFGLLTACGGLSEEENLANGFREDYMSMVACGAMVNIHSDYGSRVYDYVAEFSYVAEEGISLTLLEPEILAGMTATATEGKTALIYDGITMETGDLNSSGLSPMDSLPVILNYIQHGYMISCGAEDLFETSCLRLNLITGDESLDEETELIIWLERDTGALVQCEMLCDGYAVIRLTFEDFYKENEKD